MIINIFNEISWKDFSNLANIRNLPLNEQVKRYNQYLYELSEARINWNTNQNKGPRTDTFFLLQENDDYLLQEDGSKLIWN